MMARRSSGIRRMSTQHTTARSTTSTAATPTSHGGAPEGLGKYVCTAGACDGVQCVVM